METTKKTQILIVEDEGIVAKDLQFMLRRLGYHVPATAGTGEAAIKYAQQNQPDLILMDIQLRGPIDGVETAGIIAAQQDVPIVYLTANSDEATLQRAKKTAPFGFLVKPFEERSIQAGIEMAIYKHQNDRRTREREQWLGTTLSSIADGVITIDRLGAITFLNAAAEKLSGWETQAAAGLNYTDVFKVLDATTRELPPDRVAMALSEGTSGSFNNNTLLTRRDGSEVPIVHSVAPIPDARTGQISGCVIVFSDVSDRKALEQQLQHVQKMEAIGKLAGGVAHDFNNAITAIRGYAELILMNAGETPSLGDSAKQIVRAAEHSARLTHQLLAFSRKQVLQPVCLDLGHELDHVSGLIRRLVGEHITLGCDVAEDLWPTLADAGQIQQVMLNMSINARDAMPNGGRLQISLRNVEVSAEAAARIPDGRPGEFICLGIADSGTGMPPETMQRIFEPFFTTKNPGKGTGLGLATCYGIVKQTGGMISVASELGVGTTFSIYLPRTTNAVVQTKQTEDPGMPTGTETIFVVEDEEIVRELGVEVLRGLGYRVFHAENGAEAVEWLQTNIAEIRPDLIMTDVVMPRMSGRELVEWVTAHIGPMPVLLTSGYTDDEVLRNAVGGSAVEYLQKPFTPKGLAQKIRQILDHASATSRVVPFPSASESMGADKLSQAAY